MPFSKISPSLFAPEGHFTESADSLLNAGEYCLVHTPWDFCGNARTSVRATHTRTRFSPRVIPEPPSLPASNQIEQPATVNTTKTIWLPVSCRSGEQSSDNCGWNICGESDTSLRHTASALRGVTHREMYWRKSQSGRRNDSGNRDRNVSGANMSLMHTDTHRHTHTHARAFCLDKHTCVNAGVCVKTQPHVHRKRTPSYHPIPQWHSSHMPTWVDLNSILEKLPWLIGVCVRLCVCVGSSGHSFFKDSLFSDEVGTKTNPRDEEYNPLCSIHMHTFFHTSMTAMVLRNHPCIEAVRVFSWLRRRSLYIDASFLFLPREAYTLWLTRLSCRLLLKERHRRCRTQVAALSPLFCDFLKDIIKGSRLGCPR